MTLGEWLDIIWTWISIAAFVWLCLTVIRIDRELSDAKVEIIRWKGLLEQVNTRLHSHSNDHRRHVATYTVDPKTGDPEF